MDICGYGDGRAAMSIMITMRLCLEGCPMYPSSPILAATLRALHGEDDALVVAPALRDKENAHVLALAPDIDPVIRALGALAVRLAVLTAAWHDQLARASRRRCVADRNAGRRAHPGNVGGRCARRLGRFPYHHAHQRRTC